MLLVFGYTKRKQVSGLSLMVVVYLCARSLFLNWPTEESYHYKKTECAHAKKKNRFSQNDKRWRSCFTCCVFVCHELKQTKKKHTHTNWGKREKRAVQKVWAHFFALTKIQISPLFLACRCTAFAFFFARFFYCQLREKHFVRFFFFFFFEFKWAMHRLLKTPLYLMQSITWPSLWVFRLRSQHKICNNSNNKIIHANNSGEWKREMREKASRRERERAKKSENSRIANQTKIEATAKYISHRIKYTVNAFIVHCT